MDIVILTTLTTPDSAGSVLPALDLLPHRARCAKPDVNLLLSGPQADVVLVDARADLAEARSTCRVLHSTGLSVPLLAVLTEAGLAAVHSDWGIDDVVVTGAGPAEVEARLRLASGRTTSDPHDRAIIRAGDLTIDPDTYAAKLKGRPLDLTYKEFELLRYLSQHPGRVFSRDQLLREVWGYDYFGGTRTVDVHVRRLRAKLGSENESMIGTVRQVGYKFVTPPVKGLSDDAPVPARLFAGAVDQQYLIGWGRATIGIRDLMPMFSCRAATRVVLVINRSRTIPEWGTPHRSHGSDLRSVQAPRPCRRAPP